MSLLERAHDASQAWHGDFPVSNRYTYGLAGERFFRAIQEEGKILGTHCPQCDHTYVPAVAFCERCLSALDEWVEVGNRGEVYTFTLLYVNYDGTPRQVPGIVAFIKLGDGGLVHRLAGVKPEEVEIGMLVEAVFKPPEERAGSILDISHFKPAPAG